jgi:hypothetical protein
VLAIALLLTPGTAWAAKGEISCVADRLGPDAMARISGSLLKAVNSGGDASTPLDADRDALLSARDACRKENDWSPDATAIAVSFLQARAALMAAEPALAIDRVDGAKLSAAYRALAESDRRSLLGKMNPAVRSLVYATSADPRVQRDAILYLSAFAGLEFYPAEFAAA